MTVKELKELLDKYDENARVQIYDEEYGFIDIMEVFESTANGFIKVNIY